MNASHYWERRKPINLENRYSSHFRLAISIIFQLLTYENEILIENGECESNLVLVFVKLTIANFQLKIIVNLHETFRLSRAHPHTHAGPKSAPDLLIRERCARQKSDSEVSYN